MSATPFHPSPIPSTAPASAPPPLPWRFLLHGHQMTPLSPLFSSSRPAHDALGAHFSLHDPGPRSHRRSPLTTPYRPPPINPAAKLYPSPPAHSFPRTPRSSTAPTAACPAPSPPLPTLAWEAPESACPRATPSARQLANTPGPQETSHLSVGSC